MTQITTRAGKGAPLTHEEMDQNLVNLNTDKAEAVDVAALDVRVGDAEVALADTAPANHTHDAAAIVVAPVGGITATDVQAALEVLATDKEDINKRGAANGYAGLDATGRVPLAQLPDVLSHDKGYHATPAALVAAYPVGTNGDHAIVDSTATQWLWDDGAWVDTDTKGQVSRVNGQVGDVALTASDVPFTPASPMTAFNVQEAIDQARTLADAAFIGGIPADLSAAAVGDLLTVGGTPQDKRIVPTPSVSAPTIERHVFTQSGNFIKPAGMKGAVLRLISGGAGGVSGSSATGAGGAGGGGSGYTELWLDASEFGATTAVTIGAGGKGGVAVAGGGHVAGDFGGVSMVVLLRATISAAFGFRNLTSTASTNGSAGGGTVASNAASSGGTTGPGNIAFYNPSGALAGGSGAGGGGAPAGNGYAGGRSDSGGLGLTSNPGAAGGGTGVGSDAVQHPITPTPTLTDNGGGGGGGGQADGGKGGKGPGYGSGGGGGGGCGPGNKPGDGGDGQPGFAAFDVFF